MTEFEENLVLTAILTHLHGTKRTSQANVKFNCPMCVLRGETPDKRYRCGMWNNYQEIGFNCFNCGFKTRYIMGQPLGKNMQAFLTEIGVPSIEVLRLKHWAMSLKNIVTSDPLQVRPLDFQYKALPVGARTIEALVNDNCNDNDFLQAIEYLYGRGDTIAEATTYYWTASRQNNLNRRIIIPCYYDDNMIGWTARGIDDTIEPKYFKELPQNFLFNTSALSRKIVIIVEGVFDALAIDGVGVLGAELNEIQAKWIVNSGKQIICLPDRDKAGGRLIDHALKYHWAVSFPRPTLGANRGWWTEDIKDAAAAVTKYGQLYTLRSIIAATTENIMKINIIRNSYFN